jgi:hypothetical protein
MEIPHQEMTMAIPRMKILMVAAPLMMAALVPGKPKPITVTGCLQKSAAENEFILTTKRGKKYEVASTTLGLAGHVGHTVTIKGAFRREREEKGETRAQERMEEKNGGEAAEAHEAGHIDATSLKMVKATCS